MTATTTNPSGGVKVHAGARPEPRQATGRTVAPAVDIYEDGDKLCLIADLPGISTEDVRLDVDKDVLTIGARFTGEGFFKGEAAYSELAPCEYYRAFALGEDLDAARITATMKNGVLELVLPKAERAKTRKIPVNLA
ncbi:MAG TPA: Hsp20/alpha crystallin family protein [Planctomycetota bacterium]|nr:Hsp20/alpha crystallin family protein [Planctomycetota bacterium]